MGVAVFEEIAVAVLKANGSVATLVVAGIAATYAGIWDKQGISDLGKLVFHMSMPALVFGKVLDEISIPTLKQLWVLPVFCFFHILSAYILMKVINCVLRIKGADAKATLGCTMFGNCGSLAIAVVAAMCQSDPLKTEMGGYATCSAKGVSYCAIYVIAWNILLWGLGDALLFPDNDEEDTKDSHAIEAAPQSTGGASKITAPASEPMLRRNSMSVEVPNGEGKRLARATIAVETHGKGTKRVTVAPSSRATIKLSPEALKECVSRMPVSGGIYQMKVVEQGDESASTSSLRDRMKSGFQKKVSKPFIALCKKLVKSPPIQAATLAICLGLCAPVKALFVGSDAPLSFILTAANQMGNAQVPASMVMLSGSGTLRYLKKIQEKAAKELKEQLGETVQVETFSFGKLSTFLILFGRLLIMPFVGYFWWRLFVNLGWWPGDQDDANYGKGMLAFICLIEACVPTAQSIVTMFIVRGDVAQGGAIAELILIQMALSIVFFSGAAAYFEVVTL
eukprot:TRINITY_DN2288_c1_g2_i1.p1 TRINITY_DN2288_c1_g2~~TRINITY_DN2288_c1_g2_i1.p1  ORF type:complete len:529 (+),score=104.45 TRINITY_DN2288_c1_g2_i1:62-1588(+)